MAMVMPIFILLVFGIIEFGRAMMVHQVLVNSAREGARYAVTPNSTDSTLTNKVAAYMSSAGITGYTTVVKVNGSVAALSTANSKDEITITVSVPYANVSLGFEYLIATGRTFKASVVMRKE
jgi:Flp pilus assembly protein TadG